MLPFQDPLRVELFKLSGTPVSILSLLIFLMGVSITLVVARVARSLTTRYLDRRRAMPGASYAVGRIVQYAIVVGGTLVCLDTLGINLGTLAVPGAMLSVGIGFGLQNITQNFISGLILLIERPIQKGDFVVVGDIVGTVIEIEMRATKIVSRDGVAMIVPNSEFVSGRVFNQSHPTTRKRVRIGVGVGYGSDTRFVRDVLIDIALANSDVLRDPAPIVLFKNFGESSLDFELAVWLDTPDREPVIMSDLRFEIDRVFREKGIEIPFPQRELRLRHEPALTSPRTDGAADARARTSCATDKL
jgi:small-conductance mechanosensitive channel